MMNPKMTFTDAACLHIKKMIAKENGIGFRLSIKRTGCSGYTYAPTIIHKQSPGDTSFELGDGLKIFIDTVWMELLQGLHVDFIEQDQAGLNQKKLVFTNEKEKARCGCGESFHVE